MFLKDFVFEEDRLTRPVDVLRKEAALVTIAPFSGGSGAPLHLCRRAGRSSRAARALLLAAA